MDKTKTKNKTESKFIIIMSALFAIFVTTVSVTVWSLFFRDNSNVLTPDYAPVELEPNATPIDSDEEKLDYSEGGSSVGIIYAKDITVNLTDGTIDLLFANPARSNQDMVVAIVVKDYVLVTSGRIAPGNKVTELSLKSNAKDYLTVGGYNGKFVVSFYNMQSREKSIINTDISVIIHVKE